MTQGHDALGTGRETCSQGNELLLRVAELTVFREERVTFIQSDRVENKIEMGDTLGLHESWFCH